MPGRGANWRGVGKGNQDRIGSGEVEDDSLLSEDIKDGTIAEVDLDTALQAKVNSSGGYDTIQEEGTPVAQETTIDFQGAGVTATADTGKTVVTIPGGGGGGAGVLEKIEEVELTVASAPITITFSPAINLVDYTEFLIVASGSTASTTDIFMHVNGLTSYNYGFFINRMKNDATQDQLRLFDIDFISLNLANGANRNLANENFYFRIQLQGGLPVGGRLHGTVNGMYRAEGTNGDPSIITSGIDVRDIAGTTTLTELKLFTFSGNFTTGTRFSVYGVKRA